MRPTHFVTSGRLLRWFLTLTVRNNWKVSKTQHSNEPKRWTPALMFLQGTIFFPRINYFHSKKPNDQYQTGFWSRILASASWFASMKGIHQVSYVLRRSNSLFKFKCLGFIKGGSDTYTMLSAELHSTHMFWQLVTNWCGRSPHFRSWVTY